MWAALWIVTMLLVHVQFKYCGAFMVVFLKVLEASIIVGAIKLYMDYDEEYLNNIVESLPKVTFPG